MSTATSLSQVRPPLRRRRAALRSATLPSIAKRPGLNEHQLSRQLVGAARRLMRRQYRQGYSSERQWAITCLISVNRAVVLRTPGTLSRLIRELDESL